MPLLEQFNSGNTHTQDTLSDKLHREGSLLAAAPENVWSGMKARAEDAWEHKAQTGAEIGVSVALGVGLAMAVRNPETAVYTKFLPMVTGALITGDVAKRLGTPMIETWQDPLSLARNKVQLGANLGAMAFDYALMGTAGAAGAKFGPGVIAGVTDVVTGSAASGSGMSRFVDGFKATTFPKLEPVSLGLTKPAPVLENLGTEKFPALKVKWPDGITAADRAAYNVRATDAMLSARPLSELNFASMKMTTVNYGFPLGTSLGVAGAATIDMLRSRDNTRLGALTEIKPIPANFEQALKGLNLGEKYLSSINMDGESVSRYTAKDSKAWQALLKNVDKQ